MKTRPVILLRGFADPMEGVKRVSGAHHADIAFGPSRAALAATGASAELPATARRGDETGAGHRAGDVEPDGEPAAVRTRVARRFVEGGHGPAKRTDRLWRRRLGACVPQLRPRVVIIALRNEYVSDFEWPTANSFNPPTVGETLFDLIAANKWRGATAWRERANEIAPTIVGGSKKHGGPDLGPTRAKRAWASLGVDGMGIADVSPARDFVGAPRLTVRMVARLQGFPDTWAFAGRKTAAYRQVGNAFPPPVAQAVAQQVSAALMARRSAYIPRRKSA